MDEQITLADEEYLACMNSIASLASNLCQRCIDQGMDDRRAFNQMMSCAIGAACWLHVTNYTNPGRKEIFMKVVSETYDELASQPNALKPQTKQ